MVASKAPRAKCSRCGREYALLGQVKALEKKLKQKINDTSFLNLCPECRRIALAEKIKKIALSR